MALGLIVLAMWAGETVAGATLEALQRLSSQAADLISNAQCSLLDAPCPVLAVKVT